MRLSEIFSDEDPAIKAAYIALTMLAGSLLALIIVYLTVIK